MSVLALITKAEEAAAVVRCAREFAAAGSEKLTVLCCAYTPTIQYPLLTDDETAKATDNLVDEVRRVLALPVANGDSGPPQALADHIRIERALCPDATVRALEQIRRDGIQLVVAAAQDQTGKTNATYAANPLLRQSPCDTVILFGGVRRSSQLRRIMVATNGSPHDRTAVTLATRMSNERQTQVTIARVEDDMGLGAMEVGRHELRHLLRNMGIKRSDRIRRRVFLVGDYEQFTGAADKHDMVLIGANNQQHVRKLVEITTRPTIAVLKRSPPLRAWHRRRGGGSWLPQLSPGDYADLVQGLRRGADLNADFLIMLGLAAAIASLGLLQDSPAVVIGSMLLAPLMTPMITSGLAVAQANPNLGRRSLLTIFVGFLLTLTISLLVAEFTPGKEMTAQVMARGSPNLLDLLVALASAAAAAYAMARPNLVGAVAGVAIATALVPPLCSVGVSIAYGHMVNAQGAALLFVTNFVAIVLSAAATFRLLGVTPAKADSRQRRWVLRMVGIFGIAIIVLGFPLGRALEKNIDQGKPQPNSYPLTRAVAEALVEYIERTPELQIVAAGRPSALHANSDVVIVLTTPYSLPESYAEELVKIVRREMDDPSLIVEVHCLQEAWQRKSR